MIWQYLLSSGGVAILVGIFARALSRHFKAQITIIVAEALKSVAADVIELKVTLAHETGGNSNGLRQEVNKHTALLGEMKGVLDTHIKECQRAA